MAEVVLCDEVADKMRTLLADLWTRNLPVVRERLALLERAAACDPLQEELRLEARNVAHKLAGSLGMFGYDEGTRISRQLELTLTVSAPDVAHLNLLTQELRATLFPPL